jgi:preprotein translocase subunit YajC
MDVREYLAAATAAGSGGGSSIGSLLPILIILAAVVFFISSQRRRQRAQQDVRSRVEPGQEVITTAGLYATVVEVDGGDVLLEIAPGIVCRFVQGAIARVVPAAEAAEHADHDHDHGHDHDGHDHDGHDHEDRAHAEHAEHDGPGGEPGANAGTAEGVGGPAPGAARATPSSANGSGPADPPAAAGDRVEILKKPGESGTGRS